MDYSYKQIDSIYKKCIVSFPLFLHKIHTNVMMTILEDSILAYWGQNLNYKEKRRILGYKRFNYLEKFLNIVAMKFLI